MNIFPSRKGDPPIDFEQLERDVTEHLKGEPDPAYIPKKVPQTERYAPLQLIGHAVTKLTWTDAEKMGEAIRGQMEDNGKATITSLTAAIQKWAEGWESFHD